MDPGAASVIRDEAGALATTAKFQPGVYELESAMKDGVVQKSEVSVAGEAGTRFLFSEETDGTFTVVHYNSRTKKCSQHQATFKDAENLAMSYVTSSGHEKYSDPKINLKVFEKDGQICLLETTEEGQGGKIRESIWGRVAEVDAEWVEEVGSKATRGYNAGKMAWGRAWEGNAAGEETGNASDWSWKQQWGRAWEGNAAWEQAGSASGESWKQEADAAK